MSTEHRHSAGTPSARSARWLSHFRLEQLDPDRFDARVRHVEVCNDFALSYLTFGGPIEVELPPLQETYLIVIPIRGDIRLLSGGVDVRATSRRAVIVDPADSHWQVWPAGAEVLFVHLDVGAVDTLAAEGTGRVRFRPVLDLGTDLGRGWFDSLMSLIQRLDGAGQDERDPSDVACCATKLTSRLLEFQPLM